VPRWVQARRLVKNSIIAVEAPDEEMADDEWIEDPAEAEAVVAQHRRDGADSSGGDNSRNAGEQSYPSMKAPWLTMLECPNRNARLVGRGGTAGSEAVDALHRHDGPGSSSGGGSGFRKAAVHRFVLSKLSFQQWRTGHSSCEQGNGWVEGPAEPEVAIASHRRDGAGSGGGGRDACEQHSFQRKLHGLQCCGVQHVMHECCILAA
jgi:hypothetical protein